MPKSPVYVSLSKQIKVGKGPRLNYAYLDIKVNAVFTRGEGGLGVLTEDSGRAKQNHSQIKIYFQGR